MEGCFSPGRWWGCGVPLGPQAASAARVLPPAVGGAAHTPGCHDRAVLLYEYVGKRTVDLQHTEVPDAYRGRGIAKHLAKAALDFVVEEDLKAHLTCWYIQKYVKENPLPQYLERLQP
ncbi:PREDICTED: protein NATD1 isoform X1 [Myotis brandtii]|uniref:protein NATD1 isoform X1 n=1 Tax=Myotis brandtii TaxID=109478 RepID=UPI0007041DE8|nr:PREDICTED: protein NATD1 isoform X1 [Myotis brandtii]